MVERRTNVSQFAGVNALQKDLARVTTERDTANAKLDVIAKKQEDEQTELLKEHSASLKKLNDTLTCLMVELTGLPKRVSTLEQWKTYLAGIVTACTVIGAVLGWAISLLFKGR